VVELSPVHPLSERCVPSPHRRLYMLHPEWSVCVVCVCVRLSVCVGGWVLVCNGLAGKISPGVKRSE